MDFNDLLVGLTAAQPSASPLAPFGGAMPGFAGGMIPPVGMDESLTIKPGQFSAGINKALDENRELAQQRQQQQQQGRGGGLFGGGLGNFLGMLGDAFLIGSGAQPMYAPRRRQQQAAQAIANYLGNVDPGLAEIMAQDADAGLALYKMKHGQADLPETIELMQAAGIDPSSEEGRALIRRKLEGGGGNDPNFIRELEALGIDPRSPEAKELYYGRNSPAGYLLKPGGGNEALPTVNSQAEYDALPPGARYKDSQGNIGVKGGATASTPSLPFR